MSSKKSKAPAKKGLVAWIFDFAGEKKGPYLWSVFFALLSVACCIKYGSACCGTHDAAPKKIRVRDKNKSHYPYTYILTVDGMHCSNCATHVENALNSKEGVWAIVKLENNTVLVRSKNILEWDDISPIISHEGYTLIKLTAE